MYKVVYWDIDNTCWYLSNIHTAAELFQPYPRCFTVANCLSARRAFRFLYRSLSISIYLLLRRKEAKNVNTLRARDNLENLERFKKDECRVRNFFFVFFFSLSAKGNCFISTMRETESGDYANDHALPSVDLSLQRSSKIDQWTSGDRNWSKWTLLVPSRPSFEN